jgi:citrate lyase subunit beta-like protein
MLCHNLQTTILLTKTFYRHQLKNKHFATISSVERDLSRLRARKPRRVLFNVPGSDEKKIKKALTLDADCLVLDFEDGVALNQKEKARSLVCHYLSKESFGRAERCVRINSVSSGQETLDLEALSAVLPSVDSIVLPKVEAPEHIQIIDKFLTERGDPSGRIKIMACIESAIALVNLTSICQTSKRVDALVFGSEDYSADVGITRTKNGDELFFARSAVVTYAKAFRLTAIDMVCIHYKDEEQLRRECQQGYNLGFDGKQAIHPNQIPIIYQMFKPPDELIQLAKKIIEENDKFQREGKGAFEIDGKMIDMPMVKWAFGILQKADVKF